MLNKIAGDVVLLWGFKRNGLAFLAGALLTLALPPFDFFAVGFVSFAIMLWLIEGAVPSPGARGALRLYPAAVIGWFFGFGYFLAGLWWLGNAVIAESYEFAWALPLAVLGLPAMLAFFFSGSAMLARAVWGRGIGTAAALAFGFGIGEWLRGFLFTGFPWNSLGMTFLPAAPFMQVLSVFGIIGINALAVFAFALPATFAIARFRSLGPILAAALVAAQLGYGFTMLNADAPQKGPATSVRIVQPSIAQGEKWDADVRGRIFSTYLEMTAQAPGQGKPKPALIVWPETSVPFLFTERPDALVALGATLDDSQTLLAGAVRQEGNRDSGETVRYYNSMIAINGLGEIIDAADKAHLVPFGEYLPMSDLLGAYGLQQLVSTPGGFSAGARQHRFTLEGLPQILPLICYEIIFPGAFGTGKMPGLAVNITNDAWYGRTPGPWQHLRLAQVRAAETGVPVVRAANNGISAVIDGHGRVVSALPLDTVSVLDSPLPAPLPPTLYSLHGRRIVFGVYLLLLAICGLTNLRRRSTL
ncbi:MAG: apolipoprotein N-acyltransferase [Rhizobiaceae bacterium]